MKHLFLSAALLGVASVAQAQIGAGTWLLSGQAGYSQTKQQNTLTPNSNQQEESYKTTQGVIMPAVGYFVADNLLIGLRGGYTGERTSSPQYGVSIVNGTFVYQRIGDNVSKANRWTLGPAARYYYFLGEQVAFYGELSAGYAHNDNDTPTNAPYPNAPNRIRTESKGLYGYLAPGFTFFPVPSIGLELSMQGLNYQRLTFESKDTNYKGTISSFDAGVRLQDVRLGLSWYLGRK